MKVVLTENQLLETQKRILFNLWDRQGYATFDETKIKLFGLYFKDYPIISRWVLEWNEINNVSPLKYLEKDFKFFNSETSPKLYLTDESEKGKRLRLEDDNISFIINIWRIEVSVRNKYVFVYCEVDLDSITENGRSVYDELYDDDPNYDDEFFDITNEYRGKCIDIFTKYMQEKYTDKMGYDLEIDG